HHKAKPFQVFNSTCQNVAMVFQKVEIFASLYRMTFKKFLDETNISSLFLNKKVLVIIQP
ncbi:hypothetical protein, partial [Bacillus toyonensis]|uniref:hypothetical protein n=1 Tax=Bacillus toyonensis TaxID=155322 RepID=UPI003D6480F4